MAAYPVTPHRMVERSQVYPLAIFSHDYLLRQTFFQNRIPQYLPGAQAVIESIRINGNHLAGRHSDYIQLLLCRHENRSAEIEDCRFRIQFGKRSLLSGNIGPVFLMLFVNYGQNVCFDGGASMNQILPQFQKSLSAPKPAAGNLIPFYIE